MKDLNKEDLQFLLDIKTSLDTDSQCEVFLKYKDIYILLEPHGPNIVVYVNGKEIAKYLTFDEMIYQFILDGKPFIERISEIEYE